MSAKITCTIEWNVLSLEDWQKRFATIRRANLLQSYDYALAACVVNRQTARWGLIKIDGVEAGLVQMLEAKVLGSLFHALIIDRGPLWFEGFGSAAHILAFATTLHLHFPKRIGRARRFIPEYPFLSSPPPSGDPVDRKRALNQTPVQAGGDNIFGMAGLKKTNTPPYQTIWLDLEQDEETLRAALKKRWRSTLKNAEKSDLIVEWDEDGTHFTDLLKGYVMDKAAKGYNGPSVELLEALAKTFGPAGKMLIGRTLMNDKPCASILVLCHGSSATYQIGWTDNVGRDTGAHHLLLWQAMLRLKNNGYKDFDLGGVNEKDAKGVKLFKDGMGGQLITLCGLYT